MNEGLKIRGVAPLLIAAAATTWACMPAGGGTTEGEAAAPEGATTTTQVASAQARRPPRGVAWVIFGSDTVIAEVARTEEEQGRGLMHRETLPEGTGMLFIWSRPERRSFWMQNTYVALDVGFMDADYRIFDIQQMEPMTTDIHESPAPAFFALEVPKGWFTAHGVAVGDRAEIMFGS